MPKAAIFDLDGTLLDSVDLHALAWQEALLEFGHDVSFEKVRGQIGKGGDKLIPVFLSVDEQRDHGKELEEWRGKRFKSEYLPLVRPFSAVPNLLRRVRDAGVRIAVASSAKKDEVDEYLDIARVVVSWISQLVPTTSMSQNQRPTSSMSFSRSLRSIVPTLSRSVTRRTMRKRLVRQAFARSACSAEASRKTN